MKIPVLGLEDHRIQQNPRGFRSPRRGRRRRQLEMLLSKTLETHHVDFVGEETYPDRDTIARPVAQRHNVRWHSVELALEMRNQLGIEENQQSRPLPPNETRVSSHGVREEYMVKTVLEKAENAQTALIVCGCIHAGALVERFRRAGHPADRFVT